MNPAARALALISALVTGCATESSAGPQALAAAVRSEPQVIPATRVDSIVEDVVRVIPHDGMTLTTETLPTILITSANAELSDAQQAAWAARCRLLRLPGGESERLTAHYVPPNPDRPDDHVHRFEFVPSAAMTSAWYQFVVDLSELPRVSAQQGVPEIRSHVFAVRFRPDSHPIVNSVSIVELDDASALTIQLSERVFVTDGDIAMRLNGAPAPCRLNTRFVLQQPDYGAEAAPDDVPAPQSALIYACQGQMLGTIDFEFAQSVRSALDQPVFGADDRSPGRQQVEHSSLARGSEVNSHVPIEVPQAFLP